MIISKVDNQNVINIIGSGIECGLHACIRNIGQIQGDIKSFLLYLLFTLLYARQHPLDRSHNALSLSIITFILNFGSVQYGRSAFFLQIHPMQLPLHLAPFLEKYTSFSYGKRKTWVVISQLICFLVLLFCSHFTNSSQAPLFALLFMITEFFTTIQDISLDSLSIKQIKCPEKTSIVQSAAASFGTVVGSLVLLKFTSHQFAEKIGLSEAITTPGTMIQVIAFVLLISSIILHIWFTETDLDCQRRGKQKSICQIVSYSRAFLNIKSKYCRIGIFLLIYNQGFNFYEAGYDYELIRAGFSRDNSNTISNLVAIPVLMLTFKITQMISKHGPTTSLRIVLFFICMIYAFNTIVFPLRPWAIVLTQFISQTLLTSKAMVIFIYLYSFPLHGFTGMFITFILSIWNLGEIKTLNTLAIDRFGWKLCSMIGLSLQIIIISTLPELIAWIDRGTIDIDSSLMMDDDSRSRENDKLTLSTYTKGDQQYEEEEF